MGSQGVGHDWVTELNWTELCSFQDLSSVTRVRTHVPCSGSPESQPLNGQGSPTVIFWFIPIIWVWVSNFQWRLPCTGQSETASWPHMFIMTSVALTNKCHVFVLATKCYNSQLPSLDPCCTPFYTSNNLSHCDATTCLGKRLSVLSSNMWAISESCFESLYLKRIISWVPLIVLASHRKQMVH